MDLSKFSEYGLIGLILAALFFILWRLLVWVMAFVKDQSAQQISERENWMATINKQNDLLNKISNSVDDHDRRADERGKFVRIEHDRMIKVLDEQAKVLARINGYKNP